MIILVDMDDVIVEFEKKIIQLILQKYPEKKELFNKKRTKFKLDQEFPEFKDLIKEIKSNENLMDNIEFVDGAIKALKEIKEKGHEVFICTSPIKYYNSVLGKYKWIEEMIEENLGSEWIKNIILTKDKTLIKGDILIDDKPQISGLKNPEWEHVIFDRPYNKHIQDKKRLNWSNWKDVLDL